MDHYSLDNRKVCFFGSDARPLYKKGTFEILAMPDGYTRQYRYKLHQTSFDLTQINSILNKDCIVFHTAGNDLTIPANQRVIKNTSIREGKVLGVNVRSDTGLVHFFIQLGRYKNVDIAPGQDELMPPFKFLSELNLMNEGSYVEWHEKVIEVKKYFSDTFYFKFNILDSNLSKNVIPVYNKLQNQCYYSLQDEMGYALDLAFFDTSNSAALSIKISKENNDVFKIAAPETIDLGANRDNVIYNLYTLSLNTSETYSFLYIQVDNSILNQNNIGLSIPIRVKKNKKRSFQFGLYSICAAVSLVYAKIISDTLDLNGIFSWILAIHCMVVVTLGFLSSYKLYMLFNKK